MITPKTTMKKIDGFMTNKPATMPQIPVPKNKIISTLSFFGGMYLIYRT
ncbi:hypothetical protein NITUZ_40090 [Candidatus Nitrosotenuis uzonensis]|uniref:Uncharacterized protein n=1 Tax=Candidatus Nitrosotenuis uzonensis TaxID=1407055 RepID=V6ATL5_9ARCH|nr:hypothetical protein NITUZ_40090 [Candidatus Nitrosotenuis uzonensis]